MINAIAIENFKGIRERMEIELRPLTLLFGPNSAGKSTVLHALHYVREILQRHNLDPDRSVGGGHFVDFGGFRQLVHGHDLNRVVRIGLTVDLRSRDNDFFLPLPELHEYLQFDKWSDGSFDSFGAFSTAEIVISVAWSSLANRPYVATCQVIGDGEEFAVIQSSPDGRNVSLSINDHHPSLSRLSGWKPSEPDESYAAISSIFDDSERTCLLECLIAFRQLCQTTKEGTYFLTGGQDALPENRWTLPIARRELSYDETEKFTDEVLHGVPVEAFFRDMLDGLGRLILIPLREIETALSTSRYLGPVRDLPDRTYQPPRYPDPSRWACGLGAWDLLATGSEQHLAEVNGWLGGTEGLNCGFEIDRRHFKRLDLADPLTVQFMTGRAFDESDENARMRLERMPTDAQLVILPRGSTLELQPHDVGIGISQVIPVIVMTVAERARFLSIEQPELHLHPRLQAELGDLFIESAVGERQNWLILETHSEHLILRVQRRIRETAKGRPHRGHEVSGNHVAVYHVSQVNGGTVFKRHDIDINGEFVQPWPDDFFEIDFYERFT